MGLFKKNEGGFLDVIRCDENEYLIWKWRPAGATVNNSKKENSIRFGSSLNVKDGEVAVFVYSQKDGTQQDFIEGPSEETLKTSNFPVLSNIVGAAFGGDSPFQAEVYFINLAGIINIRFAVPFFDVYDPRFLDYGVPVAVRGSLRFCIKDYKYFIKLHRLINFELDSFKNQIKDAIIKYTKGVVSNIPNEKGIPVVQLERYILQVSDVIEDYLKKRLQDEFGVFLSSLDVETIELDKSSEGYRQLKTVTQDVTTKVTLAQTDVDIKQMQDMQRVQIKNLEETQRIQREEMQRAQKLQTEGSNIGAHQLNLQSSVGIASANALGQMGSNGGTNIDLGNGGGFNPASMMAGMAMGSAIGTNMAGMMNGMLGGLNQQVQGGSSAPPVPPNIPVVQFNVVVNGQSTGPYDISTLTKMAQAGQFTKTHLVWKNGMESWQPAETIAELATIFSSQIPPVPPANVN